MSESKRRLGDRKDGRLLRDLDPMHYIMPHMYPNRCDNEAYISERIDLENINAFLAEKNADESDFPYTLFHILVTALIKTITLRPKMNRFIANKNMYQRNEVSAAFTIKKEFRDDGHEGLAFIHSKDEYTLEDIHNDIRRQVKDCRSGGIDPSSNAMDIFTKMPRWFSKLLLAIAVKLEKHGKLPRALIATDPYYSSVVLSNVGSIKLKCGYHHLTNWGTTSVFCLIGEKTMRPVIDEEGNEKMHEFVELGLTIDERLADGYYYSKTIRLLKKLLENPQLLELPMNEKVEY